MKKILLGVLGILILAGGINLQDGLAQVITTISGYVTSGGTALTGVTMNGLPGNPVTDSSGNYSAEVPSGWSGTVKPQKIGYAIHPAKRVYSEVTLSIQENYTATVLPKMALVLDKATPTYNVGEPIMVTLTIENQGSDIITTQGFMNKDFTLGLRFTDPDENLITANLPPEAVLPTPPPPPSVSISGAESIQAEYIEIVLGPTLNPPKQGWVWSNTFNALDSYTLTKAGNYSVKAKFSMSDYLDYYETAPGSGIFYSPLESGSSGDVESNVASLTLLPSLDHIGISPSSSTIIAGGSQSYTVTAYDSSNNSLGDVTGTTTFSISPDGSCTGATCTATTPGPHTVTGNDGGKTAIASLQVSSGLLDHIIISPISATIIVGGSQVYATTGYDQYNNSLGDVTAATAFSITPNGSCTGNACTATVVGPHTVTGNDSGKTATASLRVIYNYSGFSSPVDNPPTVNVAKGGQAVRIKWQLTDANGVGISDPGSFAGLTSYQANCSQWGGMTDPIPEEPSGASGLQYLGSGNWQYNWKTSKGYAGTCRVMVLTLNDGTQHTAEFKFK
jgi:hypothetical protein